jgi:hypothetical protein
MAFPVEAFNMEAMIQFMQAELHAEMVAQAQDDGIDPDEQQLQQQLYDAREQQALEKIDEFWNAIELHGPNYPGWDEDGLFQEDLDVDLNAIIIPNDLGNIAIQLFNIILPLMDEMEENPLVRFEDWRFWNKFYDDDHLPFLFGRYWNDLAELADFIQEQYEAQQMPLPPP